MIEVEISSYGRLSLKRLLLDYNGTLALDGMLEDGVKERLKLLSEKLDIYVITADTFGTAVQEMEKDGVTVEILHSDDHTAEKRRFLERLGAEHTVAVGNGNNDSLMLEYSVLGIAVLGGEGCAMSTLGSADILCAGINDALDLLLHPKRLIASLRR
jgi:soluble P-type ATPase